MIHGFGASGVMFFPILKGLLEHYKLVLIDQLGFGASSKVRLSEETTLSQEAMDEYMVGWLTKWLDSMTKLGHLPQKFNLHGHSYGGYMSSLFALAHPDRIEALFLNSPIGPETMPEDFDPLLHTRMSGGHTEPPSPSEQRFWKY